MNRLRPQLVLASGSPYRRQLLERLGLSFDIMAPDIDEAALPGEAPEVTARRLARGKAEAIGLFRPDALVIGSDQVAECEGDIFGKPGTHEAAVDQLRRLSGCEVRFHSGLCLLAPAAIEPVQCAVVTTHVRFRDLDDDGIERYLRAETPYDCAGSAKSEGLGITLLERIECDDPTALVGLPLIRLVTFLHKAGVVLP